MKITFLGCGTSTGVPVIGCACSACLSTFAKNKRTRSSIAIESGSRVVLIDTTPELRVQALASRLPRVDAVLYTHRHADHIHGIDDLRSFNRIQNEVAIACYGDEQTINRLKVAFAYIFETPGSKNKHGWKPNLTASIIDGPFSLFDLDIIPIEIGHGGDTILGYRIGRFAYLTDCSYISPQSLDLLKGTEIVVIGALRQRPHPSHFSIDQAIEASRAIGAHRTFLTHLGHAIDYQKVNPTLPKGVELAYDTLSFEL